MANQDEPSLLASKRARFARREADIRTRTRSASSASRALISESDRLVLVLGALALALLFQAAVDTSSYSFAIARSVLSLVGYVRTLLTSGEATVLPSPPGCVG